MKSENKILFTAIPKSSQLKYYIGEIDFTENPSKNVLTDYNWQKIKTRKLLENHDDILAAPVQRRTSQIHLIFPEGISPGELNDFVKTTNVSLNGPFSLERNVYVESVLYTLTFRLSGWKRISKYFVKDLNFLDCGQAFDAVRLQLLITDGCLAFSTWALKLKIPSMSLIDLGVDLKRLFREGFALVREKLFTLPDLKPATALCVYLKLPACCCFESYEDIRNHWKNLYGYNLPENEEGMLFVEVTFNRTNATYIYPIVCVCPYEPIQFKSKDGLRLINDFSEALKADFPKICRFNLQINMKNDNIFHPISKLYLASEVIDRPNLSLLVADSNVIHDFNKENVSIKYPCRKNKRCNSPPLFFPSFERFPPKPTSEPFKCVPIFKPRIKTNNQLNSKISTIDSQHRSENFNSEVIIQTRSKRLPGINSDDHLKGRQTPSKRIKKKTTC